MCGILCVVGADCCTKHLPISKVQELCLKYLKHRGPDGNGTVYSANKYILSHQRLSIIGVNNGKQPLKLKVNNTNNIFLSCNGEIYNHEILYKQILNDKIKRFSESDNEIIIYLYKKYKNNIKYFLSLLRGMYSFILIDHDMNNNSFNILIVRDPMGIKPLYYGYKYDQIWIASELKALLQCNQVHAFPAGNYCYIKNIKNIKKDFNKISLQKFFNFNDYLNLYKKDNNDYLINKMKQCLLNSVKKRMMRDEANNIEIGCYLSGGLDSSLITGLACKYTNKLHTFSIGFKESGDIIHSRKVIKHLKKYNKNCNIVHHERIYSLNDILANDGDVIKKAIYYIESFEVALINSGIPNILLSKLVNKYGVKVILTGEGADELFGGYVYLSSYRNSSDLQKEILRITGGLSSMCLRRSDGVNMYYGIEARVPFLDYDFVDSVLRLHPKYKYHSNKKIEKLILRNLFKNDNILPNDVLFRKKTRFSDGVGKESKFYLKKFANSTISNNDFINAQKIFPYQTPKTKEAFLYRKIFEKYFGKKSVKTVGVWIEPTNINSKI
eukprot:227019_1